MLLPALRLVLLFTGAPASNSGLNVLTFSMPLIHSKKAECTSCKICMECHHLHLAWSCSSSAFLHLAGAQVWHCGFYKLCLAAFQQR